MLLNMLKPVSSHVVNPSRFKSCGAHLGRLRLWDGPEALLGPERKVVVKRALNQSSLAD